MITCTITKYGGGEMYRVVTIKDTFPLVNGAKLTAYLISLNYPCMYSSYKNKYIFYPKVITSVSTDNSFNIYLPLVICTDQPNCKNATEKYIHRISVITVYHFYIDYIILQL